jgi:hypothetical protein
MFTVRYGDAPRHAFNAVSDGAAQVSKPSESVRVDVDPDG